MPEPFNLSLGGIPFSLIADQPFGEYDYIKRASDFCSFESPEISLQIHCGWFPEFDHAMVDFDSTISWRLLRADEKWVIKDRSPSHDPYQIGVFPDDFRSGEIYVATSDQAQERYVFPFSYPMGELYMMNLLGTGLGMLFHATGVIYQEQAFLFTGHGGAGKTTTARLWQTLPGARVVNDDKVIVRREAGGFRLYGTPWHGEGGMALPDSAPLKRVFILEQAAKNTLTPLHPVNAAAMLLARTFVPLWDAEKINYSLTFLDELSQTIPCRLLGFQPDTSAVDFVLNLG